MGSPNLPLVDGRKSRCGERIREKNIAETDNTVELTRCCLHLTCVLLLVNLSGGNSALPSQI